MSTPTTSSYPPDTEFSIAYANGACVSGTAVVLEYCNSTSNVAGSTTTCVEIVRFNESGSCTQNASSALPFVAVDCSELVSQSDDSHTISLRYVELPVYGEGEYVFRLCASAAQDTAYAMSPVYGFTDAKSSSANEDAMVANMPIPSFVATIAGSVLGLVVLVSLFMCRYVNRIQNKAEKSLDRAEIQLRRIQEIETADDISMDLNSDAVFLVDEYHRAPLKGVGSSREFQLKERNRALEKDLRRVKMKLEKETFNDSSGDFVIDSPRWKDQNMPKSRSGSGAIVAPGHRLSMTRSGSFSPNAPSHRLSFQGLRTPTGTSPSANNDESTLVMEEELPGPSFDDL
eukprot:g1592.t1